MSESILTSVKKYLGITEDYIHFDAEIIDCINASFSILTQLGAGPRTGFSISDSSSVWTDFIPAGPLLELVVTYVERKTKLMFDPPNAAATLEALKTIVSEQEFRINSYADYPEEEGG